MFVAKGCEEVQVVQVDTCTHHPDFLLLLFSLSLQINLDSLSTATSASSSLERAACVCAWSHCTHRHRSSHALGSDIYAKLNYTKSYFCGVGGLCWCIPTPSASSSSISYSAVSFGLSLLGALGFLRPPKDLGTTQLIPTPRPNTSKHKNRRQQRLQPGFNMQASSQLTPLPPPNDLPKQPS